MRWGMEVILVNDNKIIATIVIPTLNRPDMLRHAVMSAVNQTERNIEILITDNESDLPAEDACQGINDSRIVFIRYPRIPASKNWTTGSRIAKGKYITYLCDDDAIQPHYIRNMVDLIESRPDCSLVTTPWSWTNQNFELLESANSNGFGLVQRQLDPKEFILQVLEMRRPLGLGGCLCRTEDLYDVGFHPSGLPDPWASDHMAWFRVALEGACVLTTDEPLLLYRLHEKSVSRAPISCNLEENISAYIRSLQKFAPIFANQSRFARASNRFCDFMYTHLRGNDDRP